MKKRRYLYHVLAILFILTSTITGCGNGGQHKQEAVAGNAASTQQDDLQTKEKALEQDKSDTKEVQKEALENEVTPNNTEETQQESNQEFGNMEVMFLDVGEGSSALIKLDGKFMLIDGGDREYSSFVVSYLKKQGVETLDYVIISHYDADHLNGVVGALNAFSVANVIAPNYEMDTRVYHSFVRILEEKGINPIVPNIGDTFNFSGSTVEIVGPTRYDHKDVNDNSIAVKVVNGNNSFLFTADAEEESETEILGTGVDLKADVYAVGHHGSASSSTQPFLDKVNPTYAVVSVGADNSYGHPAESTMLRLKEMGITMFRTDEQGTIVATSDGNEIRFDVEPCQNWSSSEKVQAEQETNQEQEDNSVQKSTSDLSHEKTNTENTDDENTSEEVGTTVVYVLNINTMKFHLPSCSSVKTIAKKNYGEFQGTRDEVIAQGYDPCGRCKP